MPSSGSKHKRSNKQSSSSSSSYTQYPTEWSQWEWSLEKACWERYRCTAEGVWDFDYQVSDSANQTSSEPRSTTELNGIPGGSGTYQTSHNYTTSASVAIDPVEEATDKFAQLSTTPVPLSYYANQSSQQPAISFSRSSTGPAAGSYSSQGNPQLQSSPIHIRTRNPNTKREEFNPEYKVHKAYEFKFGKVFKVLWAEPRGQGGQASGDDSNASYTAREDRDGNTHFQKVRRFIIINAMPGHCICLPINTYSKQGVAKNGVHAEHHTIVYSENNPVYLDGEKNKGLTKQPLKIVCSARHKLDERSRLNYAKTYTVEYNVKVCFIGKIDRDYEWYLKTDYNDMFPPLEHHTAEPANKEATSHAEGGSSAFDYRPNTGLYQTGHLGQTSSSSSAAFQYTTQSFLPKPRRLFDIPDQHEDDQLEHEQNDPEDAQNDYSADGLQYEGGYDDNTSDGQPESSSRGGRSGQ